MGHRETPWTFSFSTCISAQVQVSITRRNKTHNEKGWVYLVIMSSHGNPLQFSCLENPHGQRSLAGYSPWGREESDTTEQLSR